MTLAVVAWIAAAAGVRGDSFGAGVNSFSIDFAVIGDPGNANDLLGATQTTTGVGGVDYTYRISRFEISEQMVEKAIASGLTGVTQLSRGPDKPAGEMTWFEAARFVNWLNTSTGNPPAYKFDGSGAFQIWQPADVEYDPENPVRSKLTRYALPGASEWHKAGYYNPSTGDYFHWPTGSDSIPDGIDFPGDPDFDLVAFDSDPIFQPDQVHDVDDVGLLSPYGTGGQGGNVWEWLEANEVVPDLSSFHIRQVRGSAWNDHISESSAGSYILGFVNQSFPLIWFSRR